ncbi:MAG: hypothetical protein M5U07_17025, partial [Xanthobacteraceae bacterium]|nr:hypothetical protein [Xanthobacteraceae bacterium]
LQGVGHDGDKGRCALQGELRKNDKAHPADRGIHLSDHAVRVEHDGHLSNEISLPTHRIDLHEIVDVGDEVVLPKLLEVLGNAAALEIERRAIDVDAESADLLRYQT